MPIMQTRGSASVHALRAARATSSNGSTWTTPALMNGSSTSAYMQSVTVNSAGLFVAVGYNSSHYPLYAHT